MKQACKDQCQACPFRSTSLRGWCGGYNNGGGIFSSLWHNNPFFCHTRSNYNHDDWLERLMKNGKLCLGALIFIKKQIDKGSFPFPRDPEIIHAMDVAWRQYEADPKSFDVMEPHELMEYHNESLAERMANGTAGI